jgi:hypothetical protein
VAEPRRDTWPALEKARLAGSVALNLTAQGTPDKLEAASGRLVVQNLSLDVPGGGALQGLSADLPFALDWREGSPPPPELQGLLTLASLDVRGLVAGDLSLNLTMTGDSLVVARPLELTFYGGPLKIAAVRAENLAGPEPRASLEGVSLGTRLEQLSQDILGLSVAGGLEGTLSRIDYHQRRWQAQGSLVARAFGGAVTIGDPWTRDPLLASQSAGADVAFEGISLEPLTALLGGFGKVTGLVRGHALGLEVAYGQPSRFKLLVETQESDLPQRVSVEAVESISTIGTGSAAGLQGMFLGLLKEFRYSRIGLACSLHNDRFRLQGAIHEGGTEYLVRRTFFGGIDVVNRNPDNEISFKDMRERIMRISGRSAELR